MDDENFKYSGTCSEEQARQLFSGINEKGSMIHDFWISPKNPGPDLTKIINNQSAILEYRKPTEEEFKEYINGLETLAKFSEKIKVMPLTKIMIDSWGDTEIKNFHIYGIGYPPNEEILKLYNNMTDISKLLKGWTAYFIRGENIDNIGGITKVKTLVANLPEPYALNSFTVLSNPWIRSADHYCDYLECDAEFSYRAGKIKIESKEELFKFYESLKGIGLQLEKIKEALPSGK